ncbi:uncharacterized protein LOC129659238 isoform X2 [Bubalus kerabau]|uniref:uncharacterized protein LOC129659238 isoform X2 n=1 Tax=Bubalus carabanensis TaxID=3119969 RepID=UPI00244E5DAD|nr:uncharacterized protein LOC129659238 isoform X2 [Bubalus carabanensis]
MGLLGEPDSLSTMWAQASVHCFPGRNVCRATHPGQREDKVSEMEVCIFRVLWCSFTSGNDRMAVKALVSGSEANPPWPTRRDCSPGEPLTDHWNLAGSQSASQ